MPLFIIILLSLLIIQISYIFKKESLTLITKIVFSLFLNIVHFILYLLLKKFSSENELKKEKESKEKLKKKKNSKKGRIWKNTSRKEKTYRRTKKRWLKKNQYSRKNKCHKYGYKYK